MHCLTFCQTTEYSCDHVGLICTFVSHVVNQDNHVNGTVKSKDFFAFIQRMCN